MEIQKTSNSQSNLEKEEWTGGISLPDFRLYYLGASPTIYTQQTALAAAGLTTQTPANYQLTQTAALQQQAAAAAAALQQVNVQVLKCDIENFQI